MDSLEQKRNEILEKLEILNKKKSEMEGVLTKVNVDIKDKISLHNELVESVNSLRKDYKSKVEKFGFLKSYVKQYKKEQRELLEDEYKLQIQNVINFLNQLKFDFKLSVFKDFNEIKSARTDSFPILDAKKTEFFNFQKVILKNKILKEIKKSIQEPSLIGNLIFYINFVIKYEAYFVENAFIDFLKKSIKKEFEYHFLTDRESNRLDKPEWFFEFLIKKYADFEDVFNIYTDCCRNSNQEIKSITILIESTQELVFRKLTEVLSVESTQKRKLVLHFALQFKEFSKKIQSAYGYNLSSDQFKNMISTVQQQHIINTLSEIHETKYVQWFMKYKELCKDSISYINNFGDIDPAFELNDVIEQILIHMRAFLENLRFVNREEIKVASFVFSELEGLKKFLETQENEMVMTNNSCIETIASSITKITEFNSDVFKLIKSLAINDIKNSLKRISYFQFSTSEAKRTTIVEINKIIDEYKICVYSDIIERVIQEKIDLFLSDEILLKTKLTSNEYLEFRSFYNAIKKILVGFEWKSDEICQSIDSVFEGKMLNSQIFKAMKKLYES